MNRSSLIQSIGTLLLVIFVSCQTVPLDCSLVNLDFIECCDTDENEEKDGQENESELKLLSFNSSDFKNSLASLSKFGCTVTGVPSPPYLDKFSPPPDLINEKFRGILP